MADLSTNAVTAKIRAIHARMFDGEDYRELMARRTVPEAAEYLAHSPRYKDAFAEVDPGTVHRGYVEELLYKQNFNDYMKLCRFSGLDKVPFYRFMTRKNEIECILSVINSLNSSIDDHYLRTMPGYLAASLDKRFLAIGTAQSFDELVEGLKGTKYHKLLSKIPRREDGLADYPECELRLRTDYYGELLDQASAFDDPAAGELKKLILQEIDHKNIVNAYRMKAFFGYTPEEIIASSIGFSALGKRTIERLIYAPTPEDLLTEIDKTVYGRGSPKTENIEIKLNSVRYRRLTHDLYCNTAAPLTMYVFTQLCEIDAANIVHIIEGIRYGADPAVIESLLIV